MHLTDKKIQQFSTEEYHKYRSEIQIYYAKKRAKLKKLKERKTKYSSLKSQLSEYLNDKINTVYYDIHTRCYNINADNYKYYGGKGIINNLTKNDLAMLWFRDKAYEMKIPSIDRINNNGNYCIENCQFIELSENIKKRHEK